MDSVKQTLENFSISNQAQAEDMSNSTEPRQRRPSTGAPISDLQGPVGPAGVTRPKHKRTFTGFGAGEIKSVEGLCSFFLLPYFLLFCVMGFGVVEEGGFGGRTSIVILGWKSADRGK